MREFLLVLHILGAAVWIGAAVVSIILTPTVRRGSDVVAAFWLRTTVRFGTILYLPAALLVLITGVWLVIDSDFYGFDAVFVSIGFAVVIIGALLGNLVFGPQGKKAAELHESGAGEAQLAPIYNRLAIFGALDFALLVLVVFAMVGRWGA
jgi:uncharacterized membrane protein